MYVGKSRSGKQGNKWQVIVIIILVIWLLVASLLQRPPLVLISAAIDYVKGEQSHPGYTKLISDNSEKDSTIIELQSTLDQLKKATNYQQAVVNVSSEHLNMRKKPALGAEVVLQLPVGAVVEFLYFDNETFRIGGEYGKWCKVRYLGEEGWVWGNYIKIID